MSKFSMYSNPGPGSGNCRTREEEELYGPCENDHMVETVGEWCLFIFIMLICLALIPFLIYVGDHTEMVPKSQSTEMESNCALSC